MKKHLALMIIAYLYWGFNIAVQMFGIKAGLGFWTVTLINVSAWVILMVTSFTSLQKVKDKLNQPDLPEFDFENKNLTPNE